LLDGSEQSFCQQAQYYQDRHKCMKDATMKAMQQLGVTWSFLQVLSFFWTSSYSGQILIVG